VETFSPRHRTAQLKSDQRRQSDDDRRGNNYSGLGSDLCCFFVAVVISGGYIDLSNSTVGTGGSSIIQTGGGMATLVAVAGSVSGGYVNLEALPLLAL